MTHEKDDTMLNDFSFLVFYFYHLCCQKVVKCSQNSIEKMLILRGLRVFLIGFNSLRNIPDSFKKIVIVNGSKKPWRNDEGFVIMGMKYFLLNANSLEF